MGDALQRVDHLGDGIGLVGQADGAVRADGIAIGLVHGQEALHGRAVAQQHHVEAVMNGQDVLLALQGLPENARRPAGGRRVGHARADHDGRETHRPAVDIALSGVVVDAELAERLGHAIGRLRRVTGPVIDLFREVAAAEHGERRGKHQPGRALARPRGLQDVQPAVQVDPHGEVEVLLASGRNDGGQMEDRNIIPVDQGRDRGLIRYVACLGGHALVGPIEGRDRRDLIEQLDRVDLGHLAVGPAQFAAREDFLGDHLAEKAAAARNQDFHLYVSPGGQASRVRPHLSMTR